MAKQYSVLVGLKQVDPAAYDGWDGKNGCWGCELDVENMERILAPLDYQVTALKTARATRSAVLNALRAASLRLKAGDTLVFYFSGHGGQQPDTNGDELDGQDETLIAYDGPIIDDQLNGIWTKFRAGVRIVMVSDSCNSGTNYRNVRDVTASTPMEPLTPDTSAKMKAQMIHLGGCRDGHTSAGYQMGGAFTIALCEVWNGGAFQGDYPKFHTAIKTKVSGQAVQYNEYGPVASVFRGEKPFTPSAGAPSASNDEPGSEKATRRGVSTASGALVGPRFGGGRGLDTTRAAGGVICKQTGVAAIIQAQWSGKMHPSTTVRYGDGTYYLPTLQEMQHLLATSQSDRRTWTAERFDCDDFSYVLKGEAAAHSYDCADFRFGLCLGIVWGDFDWVTGYHAVNWFIDSRNTLYLIEPQTDAIYSADHCVGNIGLLVV